MEKKKQLFARIFELDTTQVLITKEFNSEKGFLLSARCMHEGKEVIIMHGYDSEQERDKAFDKTGLKEAVMLKNMAANHGKQKEMIKEVSDKHRAVQAKSTKELSKEIEDIESGKAKKS